tara:strand:- start:388 stop:603 length:216 start_codon:yes stop_codon:yes gene_type:complete
MLIRWKDPINTCLSVYSEASDVVDNNAVLVDNLSDAPIDIIILEDSKESVDMQFEDGSVAFNVMKSWFEEV